MSLIKKAQQYSNKFDFNMTISSFNQNRFNRGMDVYKHPAHDTSKFESQQQPDEILHQFSENQIAGIGVTLGYMQLRALDIDGCNDISLVKSILETLNLGKKYKWVVSTGSGFHILIRSSELPTEKIVLGPNSLNLTRFRKIEFRWKKFLILPPSIHRNGKVYTFINGEPKSKPKIVTVQSVISVMENFCRGLPVGFDKPKGVNSQHNFKESLELLLNDEKGDPSSEGDFSSSEDEDFSSSEDEDFSSSEDEDFSSSEDEDFSSSEDEGFSFSEKDDSSNEDGLSEVDDLSSEDDFNSSDEILADKVGELWHMTHIGNISSIMRKGLLSHNSAYSTLSPYDISDKGVQAWRERRETIFNRSLHDYVPLYLSIRNPMIYKIRNISRVLCILEISAEVVIDRDYVFSNGNAASKDTKFFTGANYADNIPWDVIQADYWTGFEDGKRKKCVEFLVYPSVEPSRIKAIHCSNEKTKQYVLKYIRRIVEVKVTPSLFFKNLSS